MTLFKLFVIISATLPLISWASVPEKACKQVVFDQTRIWQCGLYTVWAAKQTYCDAQTRKEVTIDVQWVAGTSKVTAELLPAISKVLPWQRTADMLRRFFVLVGTVGLNEQEEILYYVQKGPEKTVVEKGICHKNFPNWF